MHVALHAIRKSFGGPLPALDGVSLALPPARVHGLLGENGAGKSTLMNVLYGLLRPDASDVRINDAPHRPFASPRDAIARGIGMVHQHFMLAPAMTVLDNVLLGDRRAGRWLDRAAAARRVSALAAEVGLPIDPAARVESLSVGEQQRVEILKALYRDARLLILDEPTAVLTPLETDQLFAAIARLRAAGRAVVFISHKLAEVLRVCDDLTILRRGQVVWQGHAPDATPQSLARHMVGRDVAEVRAERSESSEFGVQSSKGTRTTPPILELSHACAPGLHDVSLTVGPEILGIAGVDGNGQQELAELIVGLRPLASGAIRLGGADLAPLAPAQRFAAGLAHIPNDRKREGLVGAMSIARNIALKRHATAPFSRAGFMRWRAVASAAAGLAARFDVRAADVETPVSALSGGNQQKVILARELALAPPRLIVATNPVRGLDIAATNFVYEQLLAARAAGCGILLISSELDELLRLSDRLAVLYRGRLTPTTYPQAPQGQIAHLMAGLPP